MSKAARNPSAEIRTKISKAMLGKTHTDKSKVKMSFAHKSMSDDAKAKQREKISKAMLGRIVTTETRQKISITNKNKPKVECKYCSAKMNILNIMRWHNDNCKHKIQNLAN